MRGRHFRWYTLFEASLHSQSIANGLLYSLHVFRRAAARFSTLKYTSREGDWRKKQARAVEIKGEPPHTKLAAFCATICGITVRLCCASPMYGTPFRFATAQLTDPGAQALCTIGNSFSHGAPWRAARARFTPVKMFANTFCKVHVTNSAANNDVPGDRPVARH